MVTRDTCFCFVNRFPINIIYLLTLGLCTTYYPMQTKTKRLSSTSLKGVKAAPSFVDKKKCHYEQKISLLQLKLHETDLLFWYLSHHLTLHCSSISEDLQRFARNLQHSSEKLSLFCFWIILGVQLAKLFRNKNKINFLFICCKFLGNLWKSSDILKQYDVKWWLN